MKLKKKCLVIGAGEAGHEKNRIFMGELSI